MTFHLNRNLGNHFAIKALIVLAASLAVMYLTFDKFTTSSLIVFPLLLLSFLHVNICSLSFKENNFIVKTQLGIKHSFSYKEITAFFGGAKSRKKLRLVRTQAENFCFLVMKYNFIPLLFSGRAESLDEVDMIMSLMEQKTGRKGRFAV